MVRVYSIVSPKGGVGKTLISTNLALSLSSDFNKRTLLIDTNLDTATVSLYLGFPNIPTGIDDMMSRNYPLEKITYVHDSGLHIIPASIRRTQEAIVTDYTLKRIINDVVRRYDYVILDSSPGIRKDIRSVIEVSDKAFIVVTPDTSTVLTAKKGIRIAERMGVPTEVIINKRTGNRYEMRKHEIEEALGKPVIEEILHDFKAIESVARRVPAIYGRSPFSRSIKSLGSYITGIEIETESFLDKVSLFFNKKREKEAS